MLSGDIRRRVNDQIDRLAAEPRPHGSTKLAGRRDYRVRVGDWSGRAKLWSVPVQTFAGEGIDEAAVLLQVGTGEKPRAILGAARPRYSRSFGWV